MSYVIFKPSATRPFVLHYHTRGINFERKIFKKSKIHQCKKEVNIQNKSLKVFLVINQNYYLYLLYIILLFKHIKSHDFGDIKKSY